MKLATKPETIDTRCYTSICYSSRIQMKTRKKLEYKTEKRKLFSKGMSFQFIMKDTKGKQSLLGEIFKAILEITHSQIFRADKGHHDHNFLYNKPKLMLHVLTPHKSFGIPGNSSVFSSHLLSHNFFPIPFNKILQIQS